MPQSPTTSSNGTHPDEAAGSPVPDEPVAHRSLWLSRINPVWIGAFAFVALIATPPVLQLVEYRRICHLQAECETAVAFIDVDNRPVGPGWLIDRVARYDEGKYLRFFQTRVDGIILTSATDRRRVLSALRRFRSLQSLQAGGSRVTDADLEYLADFSELLTVELGDTPVTGPGLRFLSKNSRLRELSLADCRLGHRALEEIDSFAGLELLHLGNTGISGATIGRLNKLSRLRNLSLADATFSPESWETLAGLSEIQTLDLSRVQLDAAGLALFRRLDKLEILDISECELTLSAARSIAAIPNLGSLVLCRTSNSPDALRALVESRSLLRYYFTEDVDPKIVQWLYDAYRYHQVRIIPCANVTYIDPVHASYVLEHR